MLPEQPLPTVTPAVKLIFPACVSCPTNVLAFLQAAEPVPFAATTSGEIAGDREGDAYVKAWPGGMSIEVRIIDDLSERWEAQRKREQNRKHTCPVNYPGVCATTTSSLHLSSPAHT